MSRVRYDLQLKELRNQMLKLGCMIEEVIRNTVDAYVSQIGAPCHTGRETCFFNEVLVNNVSKSQSALIVLTN